jgi:hypothetical protein
MSPTVPISMFVDAPMEEELLPPLEPTPHARAMDRAVMQPKPQPPRPPDAARRGTTPHQRVTRLKTLDDVRVALGKLYREARMLKLPLDQAKGLAYLLQVMSTALEDRVALPAITNPAKVGQLEHKQAKFCIEYMVDGNATQAALRAGYSAKSAGQIRKENLRKPPIAAEITRLRAEYAKAAGIDKVWVLERMKAHVLAELPDVFDDGDMLLLPSKWPKHMRRLIDKVKIVQQRTGTLVVDSNGTPILVPMYVKEVTLEPKLPALAKLLDFVVGIPAAPPVTKNFQVNVENLLVQMRSHAPVRPNEARGDDIPT